MDRQLKWIPENNEDFYYIGRKLRVEWDKYSVGKNEYIETGNCFKTKEDAVIVLDKIQSLCNDQFEDGGIEQTEVTEDEGLILLEGEDDKDN